MPAARSATAASTNSVESRTVASVLPVVALAAVSTASLGIARTLIDNGTGYLTVGGRVLDAQESVGLLGLPGTLLPAISALLLMTTQFSRTRQGFVVLTAVLLAVGQFLPSASGARSTGRSFPDFTQRRLPLDLSITSTLVGVGVVVVLVAAQVHRDRDLAVPVVGVVLVAITVTVGLRSAGTAFRWRDGPDTSVTVGLWLSLGAAVAVAVVGATRRRPLPLGAFALLSAALGSGAALLAG